MILLYLKKLLPIVKHEHSSHPGIAMVIKQFGSRTCQMMALIVTFSGYSDIKPYFLHSMDCSRKISRSESPQKHLFWERFPPKKPFSLGRSYFHYGTRTRAPWHDDTHSRLFVYHLRQSLRWDLLFSDFTTLGGCLSDIHEPSCSILKH